MHSFVHNKDQYDNTSYVIKNINEWDLDDGFTDIF